MAEHTNGTIGALLNATFGNAPELLIATAALRSGFYRVVQLAMLGSMLTNLLLVFGMSCLVGGIRWQVQELRITSGNVSVGMLLLSVAGSLLPAALILSGQMRNDSGETAHEDIPSNEELKFSRVNAVIMICMYGCYLMFQLGTHKEEFDDEENIVESASGQKLLLTPHFTSRHGRQKNARRNLFFLNIFQSLRNGRLIATGDQGDVEMSLRRHDSAHRLLSSSDDEGSENADIAGDSDLDSHSDGSDGTGGKLLPQNELPKSSSYANGYFDEYNDVSVTSRSRQSETDSARRRRPTSKSSLSKGGSVRDHHHEPGRLLPLGLADPAEEPLREYSET